MLLVDDHTALRQPLRLMLESSEGITVVGEATDGREAVELATTLHPDVVLMDVMMPGLNGIEATRQIARMSPGTRVIVFTAYLEPERLIRALRAGAAGYVVKRSDVAELLTAIQVVHTGNTFFSGDIAGDPRLGDLLMRARRDGATPGDEILSARERGVAAHRRGRASAADRGAALDQCQDGRQPPDAHHGQADGAQPRRLDSLRARTWLRGNRAAAAR